ncbi:hypothetical protein [Methanobrevibacter sp. DSM 116169]|uniref:hypothetical protein n=1 Tax=Methanobrevibacter sp. DSM 116169 TaxID=3242727 RepID=UPI0038FCCEB6
MDNKLKILTIMNYSVTILLILLGIYGIFIGGLKASLTYQLIFLFIIVPMYVISEKYNVEYNNITFPIGFILGIIVTYWG